MASPIPGQSPDDDEDDEQKPSSGQKKAQKPKEQRISVDFHPSDPEAQADYWVLPLTIVVKINNSAAGGLQTSLGANGNDVTSPAAHPLTGGNGQVYFEPRFPKSAMRGNLVLTVRFQGKDFTFIHTWTPPKATKPNELCIAEGNRHVGDTLTFKTTHEGKPVPGHVAVSVKGDVERVINLTDPNKPESTLPVTWSTNHKGMLEIKFVTTEFHLAVKGALANDKSKTATCKLYSV